MRWDNAPSLFDSCLSKLFKQQENFEISGRGLFQFSILGMAESHETPRSRDEI
jgi:hypothetical protein